MKDFDTWNGLKKELNDTSLKRNPHIGEIWWCSIGVNVGSEEDGKNDLFERPILIIKKFSREMVWVLPVTSSMKDSPYYFNLHGQSAVLSQLRMISSKRLNRYSRNIAPEELDGIVDYLISFLLEVKFQTPTHGGGSRLPSVQRINPQKGTSEPEGIVSKL